MVDIALVVVNLNAFLEGLLEAKYFYHNVFIYCVRRSGVWMQNIFSSYQVNDINDRKMDENTRK